MFRYFVLGFISALVWGYHVSNQQTWQTATMAALVLLAGMVIFQRTVRRYNVRPTSLSAEHRQWFTQVIIQVFSGILVAFLCLFLEQSVKPELPDQAYYHPVEVTGKIVGLTHTGKSLYHQPKVSFYLKVDSLKPVDDSSRNTPAWQLFKPRIKLSWYRYRSLPKPGETWRFHVKLKRNHASLNPGGFDYETYLFERHIAATGYVLNRSTPSATKLASGSWPSIRSKLAAHLNPIFSGRDFDGIYRALIYGDKSHLTTQQWALLQKTGTIHLMAISGLHIGILSTIGFFLFGLIWRMGVRYTDWHRLHRTPKMQFASLGAILFATGYAAMAGFAIPTERAWLMVVIAWGLVFIRRRFQPMNALALAALLIALLDPRSVLSQGFWLSFIAVGLIFWVISTPRFSEWPAWKQLLVIQFWITLGMMPVLAWMYQQVSMVSFLTNLLVVPTVSLLALPWLMLTVLMSWLPFGSGIIGWMMSVNDAIWRIIWWLLQHLSTLPGHQGVFWLTGSIAWWQVVIGYLVLAWVLSRQWRFFAKFSISAILILVFLGWPRESLLPEKSFRMTVLDVGQGQAIVLETRHHTIVYDTGPRWGTRLDGAKIAVLPYLRHQQIEKVDLLMVSHSDIDHAGGTASLLRSVPVTEAVSGQPDKVNHFLKRPRFTLCSSDQQWRFDGVTFEVLSPGHRQAPSDNDASCVLRISTGRQAVMITGDASKRVEKRLLTTDRRLDSSILVAGHHGSNTANSQRWLDHVAPDMVVFSAGYHNRYGFPKEVVLQRVNKVKAKWLNTACRGAIQFKIMSKGWKIENQERLRRQTWYYSSCKDERSQRKEKQ